MLPLFCREYVYYLSLAAAGFLVFILALSVIRVVVFAAVWLVTMGRHHLWILPNLTEDVGFFASFWPLYQVGAAVCMFSSRLARLPQLPRPVGFGGVRSAIL